MGRRRSPWFWATPRIWQRPHGQRRYWALSAAEFYRARADAELLAFWLVDALLAKKHRWQVAVPLLMGQVNASSFKTGEGRRRVRPGGEGWGRAVLLGYAQAVVEACDPSVDLEGHAAHLVSVAPRLRAKGADEVVKRLLEDAAVASSRSGARLSDRSARRLFERLGDLGAVRELSSLPTFRRRGRRASLLRRGASSLRLWGPW